MPNDVFGEGNVMSVSVQGLREAQAELSRVSQAVDPNGGLSSVMALAAGQVHRYLMGLSRDRPGPGQGVLPVITGRLKNSIFWEVKRSGGQVTGIIASNVDYGPDVEARRGFMARAARDQEGPVNDLFASYVGRVVT